MSTEILAKLGLISWDRASEWVKNRRYPCEQCSEYRNEGKCRHYDACKENGQDNAIVYHSGPWQKHICGQCYLWLQKGCPPRANPPERDAMACWHFVSIPKVPIVGSHVESTNYRANPRIGWDR